MVENLSQRCGGFLKKLSLKGCENVGDETLEIFTSNCRNLENLNLHNCKKISDKFSIAFTYFFMRFASNIVCNEACNPREDGISSLIFHQLFLRFSESYIISNYLIIRSNLLIFIYFSFNLSVMYFLGL